MKRNIPIFSIVLIVGLMLIGELSSSYVKEILFSYPFTSVEGLSNEQIEELSDYPILISSLKTKSSVTEEYTFFISKPAEKTLGKYFRIQSDNYRSLFSESRKITLKPLNKYNGTGGTITVFSDETDAKKISSFLNKDLQTPSNSSTSSKISVICLLILVFYITFSLYDAIITKKEVSIKSIYGKSKLGIFLKRVTLNSVVIFFLFACGFFVYEIIFGTFIFYKTFLYWFAVILVFSDCCYLYYFTGNFKKDISQAESRTPLFISNYLIKGFSAFLTFILCFIALTVIPDFYHEYIQQKTFEPLSKGVFINYQPKELTGDDVFSGLEKRYINSYKIYCNNYESLNPILFTDFGDIYGKKIILINSNAINYLNAFGRFTIDDHKITIYQNKKDAIDTGLISASLKADDNALSYRFYNGDINVPVLKSIVGTTESYSNPIIVYFNYNAQEWTDFFKEREPISFAMFPFENVVYSDVPKIEDTNQSEYTITYLKQFFDNQVFAARIKVVFAILTLTTSIVFFITVSVSIYKMLYILYGKEFAIRKLSGNGIMHLLVKPLLYDNLVTSISLLCAFFVLSIRNSIYFSLLIIPTVILLLIENVLFFLSQTILYHEKVSKLLKNGMTT